MNDRSDRDRQKRVDLAFKAYELRQQWAAANAPPASTTANNKPAPAPASPKT